MKKTTNFFIIDNFNTVPVGLIQYCKDYMIFDASIQEGIPEELEKAGLNYKKIPRTGHNISTYFSFFCDNYDKLPEVMCLTKGHMIGRHCSKEFFDRVYDNHYFTYLYEDKKVQYTMKKEISFLAMENCFLEINNSWYVGSESHPHKYFVNFNDLLKFIYADPLIPEYCLFSPGACYIVRKEQVLKHSKEFYYNLNKIITYGLNPNFPTEAHMVERMLPVIFEANYIENEWMNDCKKFDDKLKDVSGAVAEYDRIRQMGRVKRRLHMLMDKFRQ